MVISRHLMHTSLGHSLSIFIGSHLLAWHAHQIPTPLNLTKHTFQPGTSGTSSCFQKLSCPSIGTLNHISNTTHVMKMLGIQICKRYLKQDSQLFRGNRKKFSLFFGGEERSPHFQSVQRGPTDAGKSWIDWYKYFHIYIIYHKNFLVTEDLMKLYRGKCKPGRQPSSPCLSFPFLQKVKSLFNPVSHGFSEHGLHS